MAGVRRNGSSRGRSSGGSRARGVAAERGATAVAQAGEWLFPLRSGEAGWERGGGSAAARPQGVVVVTVRHR